MRLDRIKLAGFKSFVDPTTIPLPGNLVGIVGPNGCGKSNIIDAVRWVMGESSAKHLRGESMTDVIFNGSASRKPVGVASVELVFDNSDGSAPGEYGQYREISVKRQVGRDGQSTYLLNGTRCRRKDITDIFLGTGLGSRSYAIIEQGTISRLIEAKPEELRGVIEEAAGISRYKERRHETEIRMRHTQENLARIQDLRDELGKQLANLQRQAKKAERYMLLKDEERRYRSQLLGIRWRMYDRRMADYRDLCQQWEQRFKDLIGEDGSYAEALKAARARHETLRHKLNSRQADFYELGAEIGRLDQTIRHAQQTREDLIRELERLDGELARSSADLEEARAQRTAIDAERKAVQVDLQKAQQEEADAEERRCIAAQALERWRTEGESARAEVMRQKNQVELERTHIRQLEEQRRHLESRRERLRAERQELEDTLADDEIEALREELERVEQSREWVQQRLEALAQQAREQRKRAKDCQESINVLRAELHACRGRISSLERLQQHAMGKDRDTLKHWLESTGLTDAARLAERIDVMPGWETAVETVLGAHLEAVCVDDIAVYRAQLADVSRLDALALFETQPEEAGPRDPALSDRLLDCIRAPWNLEPLLGTVYRADTLDEAWALSAKLAEHESVVTAEGMWLGPRWLRLTKPGDGKAGVLTRERELRELRRQDAEGQARIAQLDAEFSAAEEAQHLAEIEREQQQSEANRITQDLTRIRSALSAATARAEQSRRRLAQLEYELAELDETLRHNAEDTAEARVAVQEIEHGLAEFEQHVARLAAQQASREEEVREADSAARIARERVQDLRSRLEALGSSETLLRKQEEREQDHLRRVTSRLDELNHRLMKTGAPMDEERRKLEELIERRAIVERSLGDLRKQSSEAETEIRSLSEKRQRCAQEIDALKQRLGQIKLDYQSAEARQQALEEQFDELGVPPEQVLSELPDEAEENTWQAKVHELTEDIARLGAVNLTALQEIEEQTERARFLDQQHQDLTESLATLQQAIEKIDRECRARFKDTFDRVNAGLKRMFPKLFGGGQAYLELTERDFLEAGVSIVARPPGKRNSSIHLLSGGEKALTAVALVFAIFELNPAPFCLLDEVDAPLDDANVGRFSQLVREMSEKVQFLFISHNKGTMEIAQHLAGVTMKEPGVSRIVAVDIDEAVELAGA